MGFGSVNVPGSHTHKKADISDFPPSMTPTAHASSHRSSGGDPITPADIGALPLSGGTITGPIKYNSGTKITTPVAVYDYDANGQGLVIGAGGLTIVGGGEAATNLHTALLSDGLTDGTEQLHLAADTTMSLHTNCNTVGNRVTVTIDTKGKITAPGGFGGGAADTATTATKANTLTTARKIGNASFNGSADITLSAMGAAPTSHAASGTTYGAGSASNYGHVKLSDSTSTASGVSGGTAATPTAVKAAYNRATTVVANHNTDTASHEDIRQRIIGKNLLDNWCFIGGGSQQGGGQFPINQRGEKTYKINGYTIDRWRTSGIYITISLETEGLHISSVSNSNCYFYQMLPYSLVAGKQATFSVLAKSGLYSRTFKYPVALPSANAQIPGFVLNTPFGGLNSYSRKDSFFDVGMYVNTNLEDTFIAAKLELGPVQTLAHKEGDEWVLNDPPPEYGEELAKCQRYYLPVIDDSKNLPNMVFAMRVSPTGLWLFVPTQVAMRATPTVIYDGVFDTALLYSVTDTFIITKVNNVFVTPGGVMFWVTVSGATMPNNDFVTRMYGADGEGYLVLDANL